MGKWNIVLYKEEMKLNYADAHTQEQFSSGLRKNMESEDGRRVTLQITPSRGKSLTALPTAA